MSIRRNPLKREPDQFPILNKRHPLQGIIQGAPKHIMPFPDSGLMVRLIQCPRCTQKHMPLFYAPTEIVYQTECLACGQRAAIKPSDLAMRDVQQQPKRVGAMRNRRVHGDGELITGDATKAYDRYRDMHDMGVKASHRKGLIPRAIDDVQ